MTLDGADREAERPPASLRVLRFVAGLLLFLVAPVWLGAAYYVNVHAVPKQSNSVTPVVEVHDETGSFRDTAVGPERCPRGRSILARRSPRGPVDR